MTRSLFTTIVQPCSIVSVTLSTTVVLTACMFPSMIKGKIFMQIIVLISICDVMGNWPYMLSYYPRNGTTLCSFEGFCNLYFFPVGWVLTTYLTKLFRDLVLARKLSITRRTVLSVSFLVPLFFTILLLAFNTYGSHASDDQSQPCVMGGPQQSAFIYHIITYDALLLLCLALMIFNLGEVLIAEYRQRIASSSSTYILLKRVLILYPFALLICWLPHAVCIVIESCVNNVHIEAYIDILKILHGGCVAVIFFTMSPEARLLWYNGLIRICFKDSLINDVSDFPNESARPTNILPDDDNLKELMTREGAAVVDQQGPWLAMRNSLTAALNSQF